MALREDQILRYSRQILLREVGGRGQEALLSGGARVDATGASGMTAAAYLAGGGSPVAGVGSLTLGPWAPGFLMSATDVGQPVAATLAREVAALNPDAANPERGGGLLAELPTAWSGDAPWVALCGDGARAGVVFRGAKGCVWCFGETVRHLGPPPDGALGVALGTLGAMVFQRLRLGLEPSLGGRWLVPPGGLEEMDVRQCSRCASRAEPSSP
ncbi:ThiF family adenylyltransferase [Myxococcus llanfairpwllgwyngyllgogerychwyrndrobwllllantysiliogogogochensis]|uniref:ThiF family adenylyltransferase n=1 Tax=Myxococcus llanfairpwllgwyngyllgogerychwyrndrobwllllantysiliogogogochensis TaxID=2590453 RepID=A0A540WWX0_9BACT|nr:ThiF family adenylyltransferase [Myxococcus llanfairpwllgwyngyllgogerychwyrndrobwllllantysiliogogogochensis]TQF13511.1 ThiF family adenylyltransferase [Myxococcus llanfairpwllgwyngyllgogerychwyrndrobwllllantysiliogogogochensis]